MRLYQGGGYARVSSESLTGEQCTSKDTWSRPGFSFLQVVGLRPRFLAGCWPFPRRRLYRAAHGLAASFLKASEGEREPTRSYDWFPASYSKRRGFIGLNTKRKESWGPSYSLPVTATQKESTLSPTG